MANSNNIIPLPSKDFYPECNRILKDIWANKWQNITNNKLREIRTEIGVWGTSCRTGARRHETIIARLRIGHTRMTHEYLLTGDEQPLCEECIVPLTVKHIITECPEYSNHKRQYFNEDTISLQTILGNNEPMINRVLQFVTAINIRQLI